MFADECEDLAYEVAFWMQGLDDPGLSLDEHGRLVVQLGSHLRSLAIMVLLASGKTDRFHHNLIRSGRLRRDFLNRCVQLGDTGQHDFVSGMLEPLHDSLAAADWALARELVDAAPAMYRPGHEYEDDFCVSQLLRQLLAGTPDPAAWAALLERTERAETEGGTPGPGGPLDRRVPHGRARWTCLTLSVSQPEAARAGRWWVGG
jgi:hypothetical protein